jgi:hypothetical protein
VKTELKKKNTMAARAITNVVLGVTTILAFYSTLRLAQKNGWQDFFAADDNLLPGTTIPARTSFTGFEPVDNLLVSKVRFYYACVSGQLPELSVFTAYMGGQMLAIHTIVELEALREANADNLISL